MNKKFIAYFDLLGYKNFLENNSIETVWEIIDGGVLAKAQHLLAKEKNEFEGKLIPDMSTATIHHLVYADTFVFCTKDDSIESLKELLNLAFKFSNHMCQNFPARGAIVYDELKAVVGASKSKNGAVFGMNYLVGKGLLRAYEAAESLQFAATVIDDSVIECLSTGLISSIIEEFGIKYDVPYKNETKGKYVLKLYSEKLNSKHIQNIKDQVEKAFKSSGKYPDNEKARESVDKKINNTLAFIDTFLEDSE